MKLSDYLRVRRTKTGKTCKFANALTAKEAKLFNIPYPLQAGWPKRYADNEAPDELLNLPRRHQKQPESDLYDAALDYVLAVHKNGLEGAYNEFTDLESAVLRHKTP